MRSISCFVALCVSAVAVAQERPTLQAVVARANEATNRNDCQTAIPLWRQALTLAAGTAELPLVYRRLGICLARIGDNEAAVDAYALGRSASRAAHDDEMLIENTHGFAQASRRMGRMEDAFAAAQEEIALAGKCRHPQHLVPAMQQLSIFYAHTGRTREAVELVQRGIEFSRSTGFAQGVEVLTTDLIAFYINVGDFESALRMTRDQLEGYTGDRARDRARAFNNIGDILTKMGRPGEAREALEKGLVYAAAPDAWQAREGILFNLSLADQRKANREGALRWAHQALDLAGQVKDRDYESLARNLIADLLLEQGDMALARQENTEALRLARVVTSPYRAYEALETRGKIEEAEKQLPEAEASFEAALGLVESIRAADSGDPAALRGLMRQVFPVYQKLVDFAMRHSTPAQALRAAEQAKARALMDILAAGSAGFQRTLTAEERSARDSRQKALAAANRSALRDSSAANQTLAAHARADLVAFDHAIYSVHPELAIQKADVEPASLAETAELLPSRRRALLEYFTLSDGVALFVIRMDAAGKPDVSVFRIADKAGELGKDIRLFREQLAARNLAWSATAQRLYTRLLGPAAAALAGPTEWTISPDGDLWQVPFAVLVQTNGKHVIQERAVSYTPSLTALRQIRRRARPAGKADIELLALGNPASAGGPKNLLPESAEEVAAIRAQYAGSASIAKTGAAATVAEFLERAPHARIIHVASHAEMNNADPMYSSLVLAPDAAHVDGLVEARLLLDTPLRADLVVLSACETGLGKAERGEGMLGLGWSLTAAGAGASVLSQWKVDSAATRDLMVALHKGLAGTSGKTRAELLRDAILTTMAKPAYRHPFYWGAFSMLGDGF